MRKQGEAPKQNIFLKCAVRGLAGLVIGTMFAKGVEKLSYDPKIENTGRAEQYKQDYKKDEFSRGLYFIIPGALLGLGAGVFSAFAKETGEENKKTKKDIYKNL